MKKLIFLLLALICIFILSCNGSTKNEIEDVLNNNLNLVEIPTDSFIAYWNFDSKDNNEILDLSGNNRTGSIYGNPTLVEGIKGNALKFDGIDDHVYFGTWFNNIYVFSISFWLKSFKEQRNIHVEIFDNNHTDYQNLHIQIYSNDSPHFGFGAKSVTSGAAVDSMILGFGEINYSEWTHIVITVENQVGKLYKNNNLVSTDTLSEVGNYNNPSFRIGNWAKYTYDNRAWNGEIDEFRIYSKVLNEEEIKALYYERVNF